MPLLVALSLLSAPYQWNESESPTVRSADEILKVVHGSELPTVVHFWAAWCKECVQELPEISRLERSLKELKAQLILVSLDKPASTSSSVLQHFGLGGSNVVALTLDAPDPSLITARFDSRWQAGLPATFVVLQSGAVAASYLGHTPVSTVLEEVRNQINAGESPPARRTK